ncbi:MAG: MFS transporter [Rhodopseudomonas palustris]|uniref:MFS transporter n=1 Tax=Rhodopseudomonas palustris TaxID=1076 RepID=A0A933S0S3_RHOPL|nr:MFS transporter [Rhodopseudomonas palustris]
MTTQPQGWTAWRIVALLAFLNLVNFLDKVVIGLVAVPMMDELKIAPAQFGIIGGCFFWGFAVAGIVGGFVADRVKAKWMIAAMALCWAVLQIPIAYTSSIGAVIACRFLLGVTEGPNWPVSIHALYKWFPDRMRSLPVFALGLGGSIGLMTAGIIIPLVTATWGWRANFVLLGMIGMAWLLFWLPLGKEGPIDSSREVGSAERKPHRLIFTDPTLWSCIFTHFACYWSIALTVTWTTVYLQKGLGYDALTAGRMFSLNVALSMMLSLAITWLSQRLMQRNVPSRISRGLVTAIAAVLAACCFASMMISEIPAFVRVVLIGLGGGFAQTILYTGPAIVGEIAPAPQRASILAVDNSLASLAGIIAPIATGYLVQYSGIDPAAGYEAAFAMTGALFAVASAACFAFLHPLKSSRRIQAGAALPQTRVIGG